MMRDRRASCSSRLQQHPQLNSPTESTSGRMSLKMRANKTNGQPDTRVVVLGQPGVGKSAIVVRYLTKRFIWEYDPTLECTYRHQAQVDDEAVVLEILDTAGQMQDDGPVSSRNVNIADGNGGGRTEHSTHYARWGDGFLVVYSITDRRSFERAASIKKHLDDVKKFRNVSCVLVGNKTDLEHERCVSTAEGERLAAECACAFFETSACDGGGDIEEAFHELQREVRRRKNLEGKTRRRNSAQQQVKQVLTKVLTKIQNG